MSGTAETDLQRSALHIRDGQGPTRVQLELPAALAVSADMPRRLRILLLAGSRCSPAQIDVFRTSDGTEGRVLFAVPPPIHRMPETMAEVSSVWCVLMTL